MKNVFLNSVVTSFLLIVAPRVHADPPAREGTDTTVVTEAQIPAREGTQVEISGSEVADLKQWIQNARFGLESLRDNLRLLNTDERLARIRQEFNRIVGESGAKNNELYVRFVLNRALLVSDIVGSTPSESEKQSLLGIYDESISLALTLYVDDTAYLEAVGRGVRPSNDVKHIAVFGIEYSDKLLKYSQTFLDPKVEYRVTRTALGLLGNDLNSSRNLERALFTEQIVKIQRLLKDYPKDPPSDVGSVIRDIRRLKFEYREKIYDSTLAKLNQIKSDRSK